MRELESRHVAGVRHGKDMTKFVGACPFYLLDVSPRIKYKINCLFDYYFEVNTTILSWVELDIILIDNLSKEQKNIFLSLDSYQFLRASVRGDGE